MTNAEILRRAARLVDAGKEVFGCVAIRHVTYRATGTAISIEEAEQMLRPVEPLEGEQQKDTIGYWAYGDQARVIALLLAAEIAETP